MLKVRGTYLFAAFALLPSALAAQPCDIKKNICLRTADYSPSTVPYASPDDQGMCNDLPGTDGRVVAIADAFVLAPPKMQAELCNLKKIVLLPQNSKNEFSWGFYENPRNNKWPTNQSYPGAYIGLRGEEFTLTLAREENELLWRIIKTTREPEKLASHDVAKSDGTPISDDDSKKLALLAVLAHEVGHIKWHRDNVPISLPCFRESFVERSWDNIKAAFEKRWTPFNERAADHRANTPDPHKPGGLAPGELRQIYANGNNDGFVTAFASVSPEEDFVETYKLAALRTVRPKIDFKIWLNFLGTGAPPRLEVTDNRNPPVTAKLECVSRNLL